MSRRSPEEFYEPHEDGRDVDVWFNGRGRHLHEFTWLVEHVTGHPPAVTRSCSEAPHLVVLPRGWTIEMLWESAGDDGRAYMALLQEHGLEPIFPNVNGLTPNGLAKRCQSLRRSAEMHRRSMGRVYIGEVHYRPSNRPGQELNLVKIGWSHDVDARAARLGLHLIANVPGTKKLEMALHRTFAGLRAGNPFFPLSGEWYRHDDRLVQFAKTLHADGLTAAVDVIRDWDIDAAFYWPVTNSWTSPGEQSRDWSTGMLSGQELDDWMRRKGILDNPIFEEYVNSLMSPEVPS